MTDQNTFDLLTEKDCYQILKHIDGSASIINYEISKASSKVMGYLGDHFRLRISYQLDEKNNLEETFFVKTEPIFNKIQAEYVDEVGFFRKECLIYKNIIPKLVAVAGIYFAPKCYLIKKQILVFEDLMQKNFTVRGPYLKLEECEILVHTLAEFHCASVVYEELNSFNGRKYRLGDEFKEELQETAFSFIEEQPRNKWLKNNTRCIADCIKLLPELKNPDEIIEKLHSLAYNKMENLIGPSRQFRNVITHCDLWVNNFMINDKFECTLLDFQLARYSPPAYDLLLTLFLNTTMEFLQENLEKLLHLYYKTFKKMLLRYNLVPEKVFPKQSFLDSVDYVKLPALLEAVFFSTNTLISPETSTYIMSDAERYHEFSFTNRSKYIMKEYMKNEIFRRGLLEMLIPLVGFLKNMEL